MNNVKESNTLPSIQLIENRGWKTVEVNGKDENIPEQWEIVPLGAAFEISGGGTPPTGDTSFWGGGIVWVGPKYMGDHLRFVETNQEGMKTLTEAGASKVSNKATPAGSLLVSSRAPVGYANLAPCDLYTNQGCYSFIDKGNGNPQHLYFWVRKNRSLLESRASGTTFLEISRKSIAILGYAAPPRPEQTLIAQVLTAQESQIHDLRKLAQAERQRLAWLSEELLSGRLRVEEDPTAESVVVSCNEKGEPVEVLPGVRVVENTEWKTVEVNGKTAQLPESWTVACIDQITELKKTKKTGGQYIGLENIEPKTGRYVKTIGAKMVEEAAAFSFEEGDLLYGKLRPYLQKAWVAEFEGTCSTEFFVLKPKVNTKFVHLHLLSDSIAAIADGTSDGTRMPRTNWGAIGAAELGLPTLPEQTLIAQVLTAQETQVAEIERLADLEQQRFEWLSDELLSGRIRVKTTKED